MDKARCDCGGTMTRVMYAGFPMWLCDCDECSTVGGLWSVVLLFLPFNGNFVIVEGGYWRTLWSWLRG